MKIPLLTCLFFLTIIAVIPVSAANNSTLLKPIAAIPAQLHARAGNHCIEARKIKAVTFFSSGGTGGTKNTGCPLGFTPYGMRAYVGVGLGHGVYTWQNYCCTTDVYYEN